MSARLSVCSYRVESAPVPATPSGHRARLPPPLYGNHGSNNANGGAPLHQGTPFRSALNNLDPNIYRNNNNVGYGGMSAGVKVGRPSNGPISRNSLGAGRPTGMGGLNIR